MPFKTVLVVPNSLLMVLLRMLTMKSRSKCPSKGMYFRINLCFLLVHSSSRWLQLKDRLKVTLGALYDRVIFYPRMPNSDHFMAFISNVDVMLHPFPFDGSKTAADAMAMGIPTVTWPAVSVRVCL